MSKPTKAECRVLKLLDEVIAKMEEVNQEISRLTRSRQSRAAKPSGK